MLKRTAHQHLIVARKNSFRAIAMVHIKINHRNARDWPYRQRMTHGHSHIIEKTKAHRLRRTGMMARRTHSAKGVIHFAAHHPINCLAPRTCSVQSRMPGAGRHGRIRIKMHNAMYRAARMDISDVIQWMHTLQLIHRCQRRLDRCQIRIQPAGDELIVNSIQPRRTFGVLGTHVVQFAIAVRNESGCHKRSGNLMTYNRDNKFPSLLLISPIHFYATQQPSLTLDPATG